MVDPGPLPIRGRFPHVSGVERLEATDDELIASLTAGDISALEVLYDRYSTLVYSVSLRVLYDRQLAEDVTQEVFLRLWRRPQSFDPSRGRLLSWLMSVTRNRAIDERRKLARRIRTEDTADDPLPDRTDTDGRDDPQLALALSELRWKVRAAMQSLPPAQRQVIELAYFSGLTQVEIAERTGLPLGTVKTRVRLAMNKLRGELNDFKQEPAR
ncbi:MAG: sigma-70 family RNA polymerase sigma factor [Dehalococcoidia bacterium]